MKTTVNVQLDVRRMCCGHFIALPADAWEAFENDSQKHIRCPYGDSVHYMDTLREENERLKNDSRYWRSRANGALGVIADQTKEAARLKRRAKAGVCSRCRRTFQKICVL